MSNTILAFLFSKLKGIETKVKKQESKAFDLIEEITIDSDNVTAIERTQEPDGTAYFFEEVLINFEIEASDTSASLTCNANNIASIGIGKMIDAEKKYCTLQYQAYKGLLLTSYQSPVTNKTWAGNAIVRNAEILSAEAINNLKFGSNTPIPLGSKITIYAVRK